MNKEKAIIFDLDGTLADTLPMSVAGSIKALEQAGCHAITKEQVFAQFGKSDTALFKHFCKDKWKEAHLAYADVFIKNVSPKTLFPGIKDVLEYLKQNNIRTGLVTGRGMETALIILEQAGIKNYFDIIKAGSETGSVKPACIKEILKEWGFPADKTYYIGDVPHDVADSKAAGVNALSAGWASYAEIEKLKEQKPLKIFFTVTEFLEWLKQN